MTHLHTLHADTETLRANETQITSRLRDVMQENDRLRNELTTTQKVTGEFRKECESLVNDYQGAAKKIEVLEAERDKFRNQAQMGMRELAQRSERVKALEAERQVLQEQLQHMDMQVCVYLAPFSFQHLKFSLLSWSCTHARTHTHTHTHTHTPPLAVEAVHGGLQE